MSALACLAAAAIAPCPAEEWTLDRALGHVAGNSPDARVAALRVERARAEWQEARSALWPTVTAQSSYTAGDNPPTAFMALLNQRQLDFDVDFNDPDPTDNWMTGLRIDYPLYTGGALSANLSAAEHGVLASQHERDAVERQLQLAVARGYFLAWEAREIVAAAEAAVGSSRADRDLATRQVEEGVALRTVALDLDVRVAETEVNLTYARHRQELQERSVQTLLGIEAGEPFQLSMDWRPLERPGDRAGGRAELLALEERARAAEGAVAAARAGRKPTLQAFATARRDEGFTDPATGESWIVGLSLEFPLWDGGAARARESAAEKARAEVLESARKQRMEFALEIRQAELAWEGAREEIGLSGQAVRSAEESSALTRSRFADGLALTTELLRAESALTRARVGLAQARAREQIALASLRHALGLPLLEP